MASLNKVILIGHLGRDAELTHTGNGHPKVFFTMATNRNWKDKEGQWQTDTEWHRVTAWGESARSRADWLKKGRQVFVEGRIQTRSWDDKGQKRYMTEVNALQLLLLGPRQDGHPAEREAAAEEAMEESPF